MKVALHITWGSRAVRYILSTRCPLIKHKHPEVNCYSEQMYQHLPVAYHLGVCILEFR